MSCGVAVLGTNVTGIRELIRHRQTGYLCGTSWGAGISRPRTETRNPGRRHGGNLLVEGVENLSAQAN